MEVFFSLASPTRYIPRLQLSRRTLIYDVQRTPVQKWQTADISSVKLEKSKHIHIDLGGSNPANLHFNAGSKDVADAINTKLESSRSIAAVAVAAAVPLAASPVVLEEDHKVKKNGGGVHFFNSPVAIILPREASDDEAEDNEEVPAEVELEGANAVALYDFDADGEDELSVKEGQQLIVIDNDNEDWWRCRDGEGREGVVPASYIEVRTLESEIAITITHMHL